MNGEKTDGDGNGDDGEMAGNGEEMGAMGKEIGEDLILRVLRDSHSLTEKHCTSTNEKSRRSGRT